MCELGAANPERRAKGERLAGGVPSGCEVAGEVFLWIRKGPRIRTELGGPPNVLGGRLVAKHCEVARGKAAKTLAVLVA